MLVIKNVRTVDHERIDVTLPANQAETLEAEGLTLLPGLIDPHVHFRTPGMQHKEDWMTGARAAMHGGYTTVFDMPNTIPPTVTLELLHDKMRMIDGELKSAGIPLRYQLFFGADKNHVAEIARVKNAVIGLKVFMGCSTGNLVVDDDESLHAVFAAAAKQNMLVAVHAEDEALIKERRSQHEAKSHQDHSVIRNTEVASRAVEKAIKLARQYGARLYVLHTSTQDEIALIKQAKLEGLPVFAETTPHHLFLDDGAYQHLHGRAVVNPPLRTREDREALWEALRSGVIDTIGSDHAPHTCEEKDKPYGQCPSGMPGIETTLPLLVTAMRDGMLSLRRIVELTNTRAREIFGLEKNSDAVLVDMNNPRVVKAANLKTKCAWSAFEGKELYGWPVKIFMGDQLIKLSFY